MMTCKITGLKAVGGLTEIVHEYQQEVLRLRRVVIKLEAEAEERLNKEKKNER